TDRCSPSWRQFDGPEPHRRFNGAFRFGAGWKRDHHELNSGRAQTVQAGLIEYGFGSWRGTGGGLSRAWTWQRRRAWTWQRRRPDNGCAQDLQRDGNHGRYDEKSANASK